MVGEDRVMMRMTELKRWQVMEQRITQVKAGPLVGLTDRHVRRLLQRVEQAGDQRLTHRGRGTPSNRRISEKVKAQVPQLYAQR